MENKLNKNINSENIISEDNKNDLKTNLTLSKINKPNPPKNTKSEKIAKPDLKFFNETGIKKNDNKHTNIFHDEYDTYNENPQEPKIISEKLKYFGRNNYLDQIKDDISSSGDSTKRNLNQNPLINIKARYNDIDLNYGLDSKEELPSLACPLTYNKRLLEFFKLDITMLEFLKFNIKNRYILNITFAKFSIIFHRYQRIGNLITQFALYAFFLSIFFTSNVNQKSLDTKKKIGKRLFILYCCIAEIFSCLLIHLPSYMFYVDVSKLRPIYKKILDDEGLNIEKDFDTIINHRCYWNILGVIIQIIFSLISFYFSFCFVCIYTYLKNTFVYAIFATILLDFFFFEFLWELILAILFLIRKRGRGFIYVAEFCNRMRHMKTLT